MSTGLDPGDLDDAAGRALREVFAVQFKAALQQVPNGDQNAQDNRQFVHAQVALVGDRIAGSALLQLPDALAHQTARAIYGDHGTVEDAHDVTGEICNMIVGRIKHELEKTGYTASIGTPTVSMGRRIEIMPLGNMTLSSTNWAFEGDNAHDFNLQVQIGLKLS